MSETRAATTAEARSNRGAVIIRAEKRRESENRARGGMAVAEHCNSEPLVLSMYRRFCS